MNHTHTGNRFLCAGFVAFVILRKDSFGSAVSVIYMLLITVVFAVASKRLTAMMGSISSGASKSSGASNKYAVAAEKIRGTARSICIFQTLYMLSAVWYTFFFANLSEPEWELCKFIAASSCLFWILCSLRVLVIYVAFCTRKLRGVKSRSDRSKKGNMDGGTLESSSTSEGTTQAGVSMTVTNFTAVCLPRD